MRADDLGENFSRHEFIEKFFHRPKRTLFLSARKVEASRVSYAYFFVSFIFLYILKFTLVSNANT